MTLIRRNDMHRHNRIHAATAAVLAPVMILASCGTGGTAGDNSASAEKETETEMNYDFSVSYDGIETGMVSSGVSVHDPSVLKVGDKYYIYGSHMSAAACTDLKSWEKVADGYSQSNPVYGQIYDVYDEAFAYAGSPNSIIPTDNAESGGEHVWAPDVIYNKAMGKYVMYYCTSSTWNASNLCYGISDSPEGPFEWQGALIYSGYDKETIKATDVLDYVDEDYAMSTYFKGPNYRYEDWPNAIDPAVFCDADGKMWLVYGSWSGGIFLLEVDEATGKMLTPTTEKGLQAADTCPWRDRISSGTRRAGITICSYPSAGSSAPEAIRSAYSGAISPTANMST